MKVIRRAEITLSFPYNDIGDEFADMVRPGLKGENLIFDVKKGAGSVIVDVYADYGTEGCTHEKQYYEKMLDDLVEWVRLKLNCDVNRSNIDYFYL